MVMEGGINGNELTWVGEHTIQYTDAVLQNYTLETYVIVLTNVTPTNSVNEVENQVLGRF